MSERKQGEFARVEKGKYGLRPGYEPKAKKNKQERKERDGEANE